MRQLREMSAVSTLEQISLEPYMNTFDNLSIFGLVVESYQIDDTFLWQYRRQNQLLNYWRLYVTLLDGQHDADIADGWLHVEAQTSFKAVNCNQQQTRLHLLSMLSFFYY